MRTLSDDRWSCRSCAACCHGLKLGPLSPDTITDLQQRDVAARWPRARQQPWFQRDAEGAAYLTHHSDGACVFLQPDRRCFLHATFGEAAKPDF
ncbi:unnamed protein product, partial [Ectocarpus fasciculatus]